MVSLPAQVCLVCNNLNQDFCREERQLRLYVWLSVVSSYLYSWTKEVESLPLRTWSLTHDVTSVNAKVLVLNKLEPNMSGCEQGKAVVGHP